jgi:hypothetical protein
MHRSASGNFDHVHKLHPSGLNKVFIKKLSAAIILIKLALIFIKAVRLGYSFNGEDIQFERAGTEFGVRVAKISK